LNAAQRAQGTASHWNVYFAVEDAVGTAEDALALGGKVFMKPTANERSVTAGILDPNGGRFMVISPA